MVPSTPAPAPAPAYLRQPSLLGDSVVFVSDDDLLVLNDTRVVAARFFSDDGSKEILRVEALGERLWKFLVRPGKRLRPGDHLAVPSARQAGRRC